MEEYPQWYSIDYTTSKDWFWMFSISMKGFVTTIVFLFFTVQENKRVKIFLHKHNSILMFSNL